jgi:hypothetical protein
VPKPAVAGRQPSRPTRVGRALMTRQRIRASHKNPARPRL